MAHTPGPWRFHDMLEGYPPTAYVRPVDAMNDFSIARISTSRRHRSEVQANAHLIAAAPDLLAALKVMVASYDGLRDILTSPVVVAKLAIADAAIAKAEGRL